MNRNEQKHHAYGALALILKYAFSVLTTVLAYTSSGRWQLLIVGASELFLIWAVTQLLLNRAPVAGRVARGLLLFVYNAQMLVMYFGNSYITLLMLENLVSVQDLSGHFGAYLLLVIPMLAILLLPAPVTPPRNRRAVRIAPCIACALWVCALLALGPQHSPLVSAGGLVRAHYDYREIRGGSSAGGDENAARFYREGLEDARQRPDALPRQPNVVLVFVEGLSQSVIEDERGIMPNLAAMEARSLSFENYYNHTFATYRGLIGQLYSSHQLSDHDANALVSLQGILHDAGYHTSFINTEPNNAPFTEYLARMNFDEFISEPDWVTQAYATLDYVVDRCAYERLFETIERQHAEGRPFFTSMYSLGTHVSLDSPDQVFGDGGNAELNKFFNLDAQLGRFIERFDASPLARDTLLVITTDHATYADKAFVDTFSAYPRPHMEMDRIPMLFYFAGIEPERVDAKGRNSLDMAPTLLDYLDISAPNLFLGDSLFGPGRGAADGVPFDRCFFDGSAISLTGAGEGESLSKSERGRMRESFMAYFSVSIPAEQGLGEYDMEITASGDGSELYLASRYSVDPGDYLWFSLWGSAKIDREQRWFRGEMDEDGFWRCTVPLFRHKNGGLYHYTVQAYTGTPEKPHEGPWAITKNYYLKENDHAQDMDPAPSEAAVK